MSEQSEYIVVSGDRRWGRSNNLVGACLNCFLPMKLTKMLHYVTIVEDDLRHGLPVDFDEIARAWQDGGYDEIIEGKPVEVSINYFDPDLWEDWSVCSMSGSVAFYGFKPEAAGDRSEREARDQANLMAIWDNGVLRPRP
tara:strand:+ start:178 stop:597 length:420 start_codon:yes stop_codon:yes gene_type:complete